MHHLIYEVDIASKTTLTPERVRELTDAIDSLIEDWEGLVIEDWKEHYYTEERSI